MARDLATIAARPDVAKTSTSRRNVAIDLLLRPRRLHARTQTLCNTMSTHRLMLLGGISLHIDLDYVK